MTIPSVALPWLLVFFPWLARAGATQAPDDRALEPLASGLAACLAARGSDEGSEEAEARLLAAMTAREGEGHALRFLARTEELERTAWLARGFAAKELKKGRVASEELREGRFAKKGLEYAYRLPRDYDPKRAYPLLLSLPDEGERPAEHLRTHWIRGELLDSAILLCPALPTRVEDWEQVTVAGRAGGLVHVLTLLRFAQETFALDFERLYLVGRGRSVELALAAGNHAPQAFAGIALCAGDGGAPIPENFANLPTLFAPGGEKANAFRHGLGALGIQNCELGAADDEAVLWTWLQAHPRVSHPERIELVVGQPFPTRSAWLRVAPSAPDARATAVLDRAANTLRISTGGVSQVTLYLSDALLDLAQPVRVLLDGRESKHLLTPRLATMLELLQDGTSDPAAVYTVELALGTASTEADAAASAQPGAPSAAAEARFRASQQEASAKARGLVLDEKSKLWIHPDERANAARGWVKDVASGQWLTAGEQRKLADGWLRQDLEWIEPGETARVEEGLWRVDGEWLTLAVANRRHAALERPWKIPRREVLLRTTTERAVAEQALEHMGRAVVDLAKVFGAEPPLPLEVCLLRDEEQYDRLAFGDPDGRRAATDPTRSYLVHGAFFAQSWFRPKGAKELAFQGMGVSYWDPLAPGGDAYGVHNARLALAYSYIEALDPSPKAVRKACLGGPRDDYPEAYEAEKVLPAWLRHGGAVYAERFFRDDQAGADGDPWWAVKWSREALAQRGGLRNLTDVFAFALDPDLRDDGQRRLLEVGAVVSFLVDGDCEPVAAAHAEFKRALAAGALRKPQLEKLGAALLAHESELRAFLARAPGSPGR